MEFEIKAGQGSMFVTEQKKNEKEPDFRGTFRAPDGHLYEIAGWKKVTKTNKKIISLAIQEPREKTGQQQKQTASSGW